MPHQQHSDDAVKVKTSLVGLVVQLWPYFMRQKLWFFGTCFAVFGLAVSGRLIPTVFGYTIDQVIINKREGVILYCAAAYFVLEAATALFMFAHTYLFAKLGNRILFEIRDELIEHTQKLPITYFDRNPTGRIVTRVTNDVVALGELFSQGIIHMVSNTVSMIAIVTAMFMISPKMASITLLIAPPLIGIGFYLSYRIKIILRESKIKLSAINAFVAENISGMRVLQLYGRISRNRARFDALSADYRDLQFRQVKLYALLWPTINLFNAVSVAIALYYGGLVTIENAISTGAMVAFISHVRDFIVPLRIVLEKYQIFQNTLTGAERIFTLLGEEQEDMGGLKLSGARLEGRVQFKSLNFRYGDGPLVLKDVDLKIDPGQSVALVGRTGSGKSTIIALLQRIYDYKDGEILVDEMPLRSVQRDEIRRRIGVVQQDTFMFRGTIAENISLNDPSITRKQIEWAAEQACCADLLRRHAGGLDAKVEERGANLSFGERQLIAFARILAFDPDILILDEATANIDSQSEAFIQEATRHVTKGRTSIIIAHRISTVLECDLIVTLQNGRIIESGNHGQLMAKGGVYYQLCQSQFRDQNAEPTLPLV